MTDWRSLRDAYGSAEPVGGLLERAGTGDRDVWDELWSRLCHQGTVYSASYAALPRLTELAAHRDPREFVEPLFLATCIIGSTDGPAPADVRSRYAETIRQLHELAQGFVPFAGDDTDFVYRVQAVLATEGDSVWGTRLDALADQELELACPGCGEQLLVGLETMPTLVRQFDDAAVGATTLTPADPDQLSGGEARAYELAIGNGRPQVARRLLELFGRFECPACQFSGRTATALS
ncbi:hypothetical protein AB0E69_40745 [Kribbella sp. NPDC026611]|uniref:hypothetical protein n=1 Tax=Kribbella sp. NPDC026611 TaxID=3154911 RepID=UPI0033DBB1BC